MYWPDDDQYYPCTISAHLPKRGKDPGHRYELLYDDGDTETLDLSNERFRLIRGNKKKKKKKRDDSDDTAEGGSNGNKHASVAKHARGGGHPKKLGDIVEEPLAPTGDIVEEPLAPAGDIVKEPLAPAGDIVNEASAPVGDIVVEEPLAPAGDIVSEASAPAGDIVVEEPLAPAGDIVNEALAPAGDIVNKASAPALEGIFNEASARWRDIINKALAPVGDIVKEVSTPVVATGHVRKTKGRKLPFAQARDPSPIIEDGGHPPSVQACTVQCTWSFYAPCSANLPPPLTCNKCSALVHHVCQINWEAKHSYEPPGCLNYCPSHHEYCQEITAAGGGKVSSTTTSSQSVATACAKVAQKIYDQDTPDQRMRMQSLSPPLFEVPNPQQATMTPLLPSFVVPYHSGFNTSPAESTLTSAMVTNNPRATSPSFPGYLEGLDDDAYHPSFDGVIDDVIFNVNHDEKVAGNISTVDELDDLDEDGEEQEQGGNSGDEGEEADLHIIALARRLINDDLGAEYMTKSIAEQIVMKQFRTVLGDTDENLIDDDVDETFDVEAFKTLPGAPEGMLPPSCPVNFGGYKPKAGEPSEEELDNPAGWSMYTFTPSNHAKTKTGARVVPANTTGNRCHNGWEFHYRNWTGTAFHQET